jgi:hypothetical protein
MRRDAFTPGQSHSLSILHWRIAAWFEIDRVTKVAKPAPSTDLRMQVVDGRIRGMEAQDSGAHVSLARNASSRFAALCSNSQTALRDSGVNGR